MRAILLPSLSANQLAPSGPLTMSPGKLSAVGIVYSLIGPDAAWAMGTVRPSTPTRVMTMKLSLMNRVQNWDTRIGVSFLNLLIKLCLKLLNLYQTFSFNRETAYFHWDALLLFFRSAAPSL